MKREKAYVDNRRKQIMKVMAQENQAKVKDLAEILDVSLLTIRRDLQYLEDQNKVIRFYGGATLRPSEIIETDELQLYRTLIAKYAATLVNDDETLFINTSSNALQMLKYINGKNIIAITNNGKALRYERGKGVNVILTGGELRYPKEAMVGDFAIRNLRTVYAEKAFLGCSGISTITGVTTENANELNINELMFNNVTQDVYFLADHTKVGKNSSFISCAINRVKHLITDEMASKEVVAAMRELGIQVHQVKREDNNR